MSYLGEEDVNVLFIRDSSVSQLRESSTEDVDNKLEISFGYNRETFSQLRSEAVLSLGVITEVEDSSVFFA